jgi:hypothetical protein
MTNAEFNLLKTRLDEIKSTNKPLVLDEIKKCYPCIGCCWNDGIQHSACWSCGD